MNRLGAMNTARNSNLIRENVALLRINNTPLVHWEAKRFYKSSNIFYRISNYLTVRTVIRLPRACATFL